MIKNFIVFFMQITHDSCQILMHHDFSRQIFEKYSDIEFNENPSSRSRVDGRTDMTKLIATFRNFANAPNKQC